MIALLLFGCHSLLNIYFCLVRNYTDISILCWVGFSCVCFLDKFMLLLLKYWAFTVS